MFKDKKGVGVSVGDVLYYDEGEGYAKGIHEVIKRDGELCGSTHLYDYDDKWVLMYHREDVIELKYYTTLSRGDTLTDVTIIGNVKDEADYFTIDYVNKHYPLTIKQ